MARGNHQEVAQRWAERATGSDKPALDAENLLDHGDSIYSFGTHFEIARILRDKKGAPQAWLINGEVWGSRTSQQQSHVRNAIARNVEDLPRVTIPHRALGAAGIDLATVSIVDVQDDWYTDTVIQKEHLVGEWDYEYTPPEAGGWQNSKTGEFVQRQGWDSKPPKVECACYSPPLPDWPRKATWKEYSAAKDEREAHVRARHGAWDSVSDRPRNYGRKIARSSTHRQWELVDKPGSPLGYVFERTVSRHWLGASLIRAQVSWWHQPRNPEARPVMRRRWAYFLSGFDQNETRPSYYFCELPPKARPTTVEEALETLKPGVVRFAERSGRDVKRQGDIFAVPLPSTTLRMLKQQGGVLEKRGRLLGTNHAATEVIRAAGVTYARGTLRHVPDDRRPDHKLLNVGKQWHMIVKNTVPLAA